MRFMMIVKATKDSEAGKMPSEELLSAMGKYDEELLKAGVLLDLAGLHPSVKGVRIQFSDGKRSVTDGPFAEIKELIAGYWLIEVKSKQEAIDWALRVPCPFDVPQGGHIELRQVFELSDFAPSPAVDRASALGEELAKRAKTS